MPKARYAPTLYLLLAVVVFTGILSPARTALADRYGVAVIVGNQEYRNERVPDVAFAHRDAEAFKRYVIEVLGFAPNRVFDLRDATQAQMFTWFGNRDSHEGRLWRYLHPRHGSDVVVFYSGHGVPGLKDKRGYLLPTDADPDTPEINGYPIDLLYANLGKPRETKSVRVFLDACFSGDSDRGMLIRSASPVFVKPELPEVSGEKLTVLTAASGGEVASWDEQAKHGMFTHHLLDALYGQGDFDGDGQVTATEAKTYLDDTMTIAAREAFGRHQNASLNGVAGAVLARAGDGGVFPARPGLGDATQCDKDMSGLDKAFEAKDYPEVLTFISKLEESGCVLPPRVDYYRGEAEFHAERYGEAVRSLKRYVEKVGREGRHYRSSLELLLISEERDDTCNPKNAIQRDKYMLGLDKALEAKDYSKVLTFVSKLEEIGCVLPPRVDYYRGEAEFHAERYGEAVRSLKRYVEKVGREGRHYRSSLELLLILEERDDTAYERAKSEGTAAAYGEYLSSHLDGRHAAEARQRQKVAAAEERERERKRPGRRFRDCTDCPEMVVVPAGSFDMGSPSHEEGRGGDEGPVHRVRLSEPFAVGVYEVTRGEWSRFVSGTGYSSGGSCRTYESGEWEYRSGRGWRSPGFSQSDGHPVVCVNFGDAQAYVGWLSRETGRGYRLLSESEWEYVARGGTRTSRYWGGSEGGQCTNANGGDRTLKRRYRDWGWDTASCDDGHVHTSPVGSYKKNQYGLHDVLGNVWEWVEDCWNDSYRGAPADGSAWESGECGRRVLRGGSWLSFPRSLRSAYRFGITAGSRYSFAGFRVARTLD